MKKLPSGEIIYSPSDLTKFVKSEFASLMDRHRLDDPESFVPDQDSETDRILMQKGLEHEKGIVEGFENDGRKVIRIDAEKLSSDDAVRATLRALQSDADIVFQAALAHGRFAGYADFLIRAEDTGNWQVWDSKLARSVKPEYLIQLCAYADMLNGMIGTLPDTIGVMLGDGESPDFATREYLSYYRALRDEFLEVMDAFDPDVLPTPSGFGDNGRWESRALEWLREQDHLSLVANIRQSQVNRLVDAGIRTVMDLAECDLASVKGIGDDVFLRLHEQARLQKETGDRHEPVFVVADHSEFTGAKGLQLLPPPSGLDVYFDMEGYPLIDGGLEYLFGASFRENGQVQFKDWWAHDKSEEKAAFTGFVDWVYDRWQRHPDMHIYHYASYEQSALKRLMGEYASRENQIDNLLRAGAFVDLYQVVRQGLRVGTPSYSIKDVERLYRPPRDGEVDTAADSIVAFDRWIESGEAPDWRRSPILNAIRDYNKDDCDSTFELAEWLRGRQQSAGIPWISTAKDEVEADVGPRTDQEALAIEMLESLDHAPRPLSEEDRITQMLAWLLEYHRREDKPVWWKYFSRPSQSEDELFDDSECLAGLDRTDRAPVPIKLSLGYEYRFDPDQDSKISSGSGCVLSHDLKWSVTVEEVDYDIGLIVIKQAKGRDAPPRNLHLVPGEPFKKSGIKESIYETALNWQNSRQLAPAIRDFLCRNEPNIAGREQGEPVLGGGEDLLHGTARAVSGLSDAVLCIQGPPGSGKTHVAAHCILNLIRDGKKVGVTSNSHKAINNLLSKITELARGMNTNFHGVKVGGDDELENDPNFSHIQKNGQWPNADADSHQVVGATAWGFSRPDWKDRFDYLFVDEAGQVSIANLVATAPAARNLVIIGDQMQLEQPVQGTHPGTSGNSVMQYFLGEHQTVPPEKGILLDKTWRMHPDICTFISAGVYEGRLASKDFCANRVVRVPDGDSGLVPIERGILYVPAEHAGNSQSSEEEAEFIQRLVDDLIGRELTDNDARVKGKVSLDDILFVAPFNMQVNLLKSRLGPGARVGSVDKFQGQEAPIVVLSMCASSPADVARGMDFLLSRNRLNVAISRAQSLAIVVGSPLLKRPDCTTVSQMELANFFCRMVEHAEVVVPGGAHLNSS